MTTIVRRKNKAYQINSDIKYQRTDYDLFLMPVDIFTPDFPPKRFPEALQTAKQARFKVNTYSNLFFKIKNIGGQVNLGTTYHYATLNTDISTSNGTTERESLGQLFQNQNIFSEWMPYFNQVYKKEKNNAAWTLRLPLSLSLLNIKNEINSNESFFNLLITNPKIEYRLKTRANNYWGLSYDFQQDFERFDNLFYEGYIIKSNRNIATSLFNVNRFSRQKLSAGFSGRNTRKISEYSIGASLSETNNDFINNSNFNQLGAVNNLIRDQNRVRNTSLQGSISGIIGRNINFAIRTSYSFYQRPGFINGERLNVQSHFFDTQTQLHYTFSKSIISFKPTFQVFSNNFFEVPGYQLNAETVYFFKINANSHLRASYHKYFTAVGEQRVWNGLFATEYKHTFPKAKLDVLLNINNIFNNPYYITFTQNAFAELISYYRWRPRQAVVSFNKKL